MALGDRLTTGPAWLEGRPVSAARGAPWPVAVAVAITAVLLLAAVLVGHRPDSAARGVVLRLLVVLSAFGAGASIRSSTRAMPAGGRGGWRLIGAAMAMVGVTQFSLVGSAVVPEPTLWTALGMCGGIAAGVLGLVGLLGLGIRAATTARLLNVVIDAAITGLSVLVVTWIAVLEPFVDPSGRPSTSLIVWAALGIGLGAVVLQQLTRVPRTWFVPMMLLVLAALAAMAASIAGGELGAGYATATPLSSSLFIVSFGAVGLAPLSGTWGTGVLPGEPWFAQRLIPYMSALAAILAVVVRYLTGGAPDTPVSMLGGTIAICVVLRQLIATFDERDHRRALVHEATHDFLTQLPNRMLLQQRLESVLLRAPDVGRRHAVILIDLDDFKSVNDALSHEVGDQLLRSVAERLRAGMRPADLVARLGGDEFAVIVENTSTDDLVLICERIGDQLRTPHVVGRHELRVTCSMGIGWSIRPESPATLLAQADAAMYAAKHSGGDSWRVFDDGMQADATSRLHLLQAVAQAVANENLRLVYQPVVHLATGRVAGAEALLRWLDPERGWVSFGEAVAALESSNLLAAVDGWVLHRACRQLASWVAGGWDLRLHVNVSAREISDPAFPARLAELLALTRAPAELLSIEVTESAAYTAAAAHQVLSEVRQLGVAVAIDDFGTGYSAFKRILDHEFDTLKIDRSFVADYLSPQGTAILQAVIAIAERVGLTTIAEGVETEDQARRLAEWGCHYGQGYFFSEPLPLEKFITERRSEPLALAR